MWAYDAGLTKYASNNVLGVQFAQREWDICKALNKKPPRMEEILPHGFRSKASLFRQVLRKPELQLVERANLRLKIRNYIRFLQTFQQRPQRRCISSLLAVSLCSVANESLDTFLGEAFNFYSALPHPLVEGSNEMDFLGDTTLRTPPVATKISNSGTSRIH